MSGVSIRGRVPINRLDKLIAEGTIIEKYSNLASYRKFSGRVCPMPYKCEYVGRWYENWPFCICRT